VEACFGEVALIPVVGFATLKRFDLADRLLASIDYPVEHLVIVDNSGSASWNPVKPDFVVNMWVIRVPYGLGLVGAWNLVIKSTPYAPYWILINDDAWFEPGALKIIEENVDTNALNFVQCEPKWSAPVFGEGMIGRVGLYDERFYPLYFDDNDMERRIRHYNVPIKQIPAIIHHENSSTLKSGFHEKNDKSYTANSILYARKGAMDDFTSGHWDLHIRRANRWD
jgi:GT2 family glycosyltransferase